MSVGYETSKTPSFWFCTNVVPTHHLPRGEMVGIFADCKSVYDMLGRCVSTSELPLISLTPFVLLHLMIAGVEI